MAATLRLWVACRCISQPTEIAGPERLGIDTVKDKASPWSGKSPPPPVLGAQEECILFSQFLAPYSKKVRDGLQALLKANKKHYWPTIYLTMFILLHNCSLLTRRNAEYAKTRSHPVSIPHVALQLTKRSDIRFRKNMLTLGVLLAYMLAREHSLGISITAIKEGIRSVFGMINTNYRNLRKALDLQRNR